MEITDAQHRVLSAFPGRVFVAHTAQLGDQGIVLGQIVTQYHSVMGRRGTEIETSRQPLRPRQSLYTAHVGQIRYAELSIQEPPHDD